MDSSTRMARSATPTITTLRPRLPDGLSTTVHVAALPLDGLAIRVARLPEPETLVAWCARTGVANAIVGGFFVRGPNEPLGELRIAGAPVAHVPFDAPWSALRACVHIGAAGLRITRRDQLPEIPDGDLLQAGPLLVADGVCALTDGDDEGFSAGAHQFDSDISDGRHPRSALALTDTSLLAVTCDGRHHDEAGMTLGELATALVALGARSALNLDGGGSTSLVCGGRLVNTPREQHGVALPEGRPISTAVVLG